MTLHHTGILAQTPEGIALTLTNELSDRLTYHGTKQPDGSIALRLVSAQTCGDPDVRKIKWRSVGHVAPDRRSAWIEFIGWRTDFAVERDGGGFKVVETGTVCLDKEMLLPGELR